MKIYIVRHLRASEATSRKASTETGIFVSRLRWTKFAQGPLHTPSNKPFLWKSDQHIQYVFESIDRSDWAMATPVQRSRVIRLYRSSLKNMLDWVVRRDLFYDEVRLSVFDSIFLTLFTLCAYLCACVCHCMCVRVRAYVLLFDSMLPLGADCRPRNCVHDLMKTRI